MKNSNTNDRYNSNTPLEVVSSSEHAISTNVKQLNSRNHTYDLETKDEMVALNNVHYSQAELEMAGQELKRAFGNMKRVEELASFLKVIIEDKKVKNLVVLFLTPCLLPYP